MEYSKKTMSMNGKIPQSPNKEMGFQRQYTHHSPRYQNDNLNFVNVQIDPKDVVTQ
jgi:hypothetical protein